MTELVIDSWAWIEYFHGTGQGAKVHQLIQDERNRLYTASTSLAEVVSKLIREGGSGHTAAEAVSTLSKVVQLEEDTAVRAGEIHASIRKVEKDFPLADAVVAATAEKQGARIVSGDKHFKHFKNSLLL